MADDIAASLRFATIDVHRVHRPAVDDEKSAEATSVRPIGRVVPALHLRNHPASVSHE